MKAWQQLIQSQTPNGLTAPSLGGASAATTAVNSKAEQSSSSDEHQRSNVVDSGQRRKSISSSREGTPSQSSAVVGESFAGKSSHPITTAQSQTNASRTPTPTPSPRPPATPTSSSTSSTSSAPQVIPPSVPASQPAAVIPRPTKAQDFARNRIRRMQMLAQVTPQSHKPAQPQPPIPATSTTNSTTIDDQKKQEEANKPRSGAADSQSLSSQQQAPATGTESSHNTSIKATGFVSQSEHTSATNSVLNGSHFKAISDINNSSSYSTSSRSSAGNKFMNTHSRASPSLSQIVTNSFNHDTPPLPPPPPSSSSSLAESHLFVPPFSNSALQTTTIAHKTGVKGSQESTTGSRKHLIEMPSPPESLLVRIPRNLVRVSHRTHEFYEAKGLHDNLGTESVWSSRRADLEGLSLTVSIDLSLLRRFSSSQQATNIKPNRTEWLTRGHHIPENMGPFSHSIGDDSEPMETEPIMSFGSGEVRHVPGPTTSFDNDREISYLPKFIPSGASPGVDGCMGKDKCWYSWTDTIPGRDDSMTVLPYIYVDDDESDVMEIFTN